VRLEQVGLTRARRTAAHVDGGDGRLFEDDGRHSGREPRVVGLSDQDAGHIGDEIACSHCAFDRVAAP
jgi:hypothetical protein